MNDRRYTIVEHFVRLKFPSIQDKSRRQTAFTYLCEEESENFGKVAGYPLYDHASRTTVPYQRVPHHSEVSGLPMASCMSGRSPVVAKYLSYCRLMAWGKERVSQPERYFASAPGFLPSGA
jgi:hypothetical protein